MMRMDVSDHDLAEAAARGDRAAFSSLVHRHYDLIHRQATRIIGPSEAEDLTQDICLALPAKLAGFRQDARFTTWLHRVIVNAARDRLRRHASHSRAARGWGEVELGRRAEMTEAERANAWLQVALSRLAPSLRETVALVLGEDMTHADAADVLGLSEGTVSWRMGEVKKALRILAEEDGELQI